MFHARPVFVIRLHALAGICALALFASPVTAGDEGRPSLDLAAGTTTPVVKPRPRPPRSAHVPSRSSRFVESVNLQMEAMSTFVETDHPGRAMHDNLMFQEHSEAVERSLLRSTRRELRDYLIEVTTVDQLIERYKAKGMQSVGLDKLGGSRGPDGRQRLGFDFGISHFRPVIGLEYEVGRSSFKFSVGGDGRVGLRFRDPRWGGNQVSLGFDGEDGYYVGWRVGSF